jgi:hypothetical protein
VKSNHQAVADWLVAFDRMRQRGEFLLNRYVARLAGMAGVRAFQDDRSPAAGGSKKISMALATVWTSLRRAWIYQAQLKRIWDAGAKHGAAHLVVVISSSRLAVGLDERSMREQIQGLATSLPGASHPAEIPDLIREAPSLILVDPVADSPFWQHRERLWAEQVFVVDNGFLLFLGGIRGGRILSDLFRLSAGGRTRYFQSRLLFEGMNRLLEGLERTQGLFFTANSFMAEISRLALLRSPGCERIYEILHGVPAPYYEEYLRTALDIGADDEAQPRLIKHYFIGQIRQLPFEKIFGTRAHFERERAINAYANQYFFRQRRRFDPVEAMLKCRIAEIAGDESDRFFPVLIAFTGGTSHDADYFSSAAFRVELFILGRIRALMDEIGQPAVIIYTPHPCHDFARMGASAHFVKLGIKVDRDTIFSWLIADACVALYSSALFEADYCGARAFTPMTDADDFFAPSLLGTIQHSTDHGVFDEELGGFLRANIQRAPVDLIARGKSRMRLLTRCWETGLVGTG